MPVCPPQNLMEKVCVGAPWSLEIYKVPRYCNRACAVALVLAAFRGTTKSTCVVASSPTALRGFISVSPPFRVSRGLLEERDARMKPVLGRIPNLLLDLLCFGFKYLYSLGSSCGLPLAFPVTQVSGDGGCGDGGFVALLSCGRPEEMAFLSYVGKLLSALDFPPTERVCAMEKENDTNLI